MVHGGEQILEGKKYVVSADNDFGTGRSKYVGVGDIFQGGGTGGSYPWVEDVSDDPLHETGPGRVPA